MVVGVVSRTGRALLERRRYGSFNGSWLGASGNNSVVECDLAKVEVAGSNPVSRSILRSPFSPCFRSDGAVAKW